MVRCDVAVKGEGEVGGGGISLDESFFPPGDVLRGRRVHQVRLQGGDASSDSYCYPTQR